MYCQFISIYYVVININSIFIKCINKKKRTIVIINIMNIKYMIWIINNNNNNNNNSNNNK